MKRYTLFGIIIGLMLIVIPTQAQTGSLTTTFGSNNGASGNMFDVSVSSTVCITSFDANVDTGATTTIFVYSRLGSYTGNESSSGGWSLLGSATVTSAGINNPTSVPIGGLTLEAGQTYGIFLHDNTSDIEYTNGANTYTNGIMTITAGAAKNIGGFGGTTFSPRTWNGTIHYTIGACGSTPSLAGGLQPAFFDGRINDFDTGNPVVLYGVNYGNDEFGLEVYNADRSGLLFAVTPEQIAAVAECPSENTLIAYDSVTRIGLYRLTERPNGTCPFQLNAPTGEAFKVYVIIFDTLFEDTAYDSYEAFIGG